MKNLTIINNSIFVVGKPGFGGHFSNEQIEDSDNMLM